MNNRILKLTVTALMAALCYVSFTFLKIDIPVPGGHTAFHLGNTFCVLGALLLGGLPGGLAGAIGMGIGDLFDPRYITSAPKTIILKTMIGVVTGLVAHKVFKINEKSGKQLAVAVVLSAAAGMLFNVVGEPLFGYFYYTFILQMPEKGASTLAKFNATTTLVNAILAVGISSMLYLAMYPRLKNNGTLKKIGPSAKGETK